MAGAKAAHHDKECVEAQGAERKVAGPPRADGQEDQQVDTREGRRVGYTYREKGTQALWVTPGLAIRDL